MITNAKKTPSASLRYRSDIDGLRAIAVVLVILYHANFAFVSGGYIGVDVFFVISGYLISNLIITQIRAEKFSYSEFYLRRIRRLAPAAFIVALTTSFWFSSRFYVQEYEDFGRSLIAFLALSSNWFFLYDVNYFSPASDVPLLHTWSLGIEEQFYLLFPILLVVLWRRLSNKQVLFVIAALAAASFLYSYYLALQGSTQSLFYNSWARFWEILAGCCLGIAQSMNVEGRKLSAYQTQVKANSIALIGILLVLYPAFTYTKQTVFPGWNAVPAVVGTILLLISGPSSVIGRIFSLQPIRYIGRLSYGLYLWHWPIFIGVQSAMPRSDDWVYWAMAITVVLSVITFHFFEQPIRQRRIFSETLQLLQAYSIFCLLVGLVVLSAKIPSANYSRASFLYGETGVVLSGIHHERQRYMKQVDRSFNGDSGAYSGVLHRQLPCSYDDDNSLARLNTCLQSSVADSSYLIIGDSIGRDTLFALRQAFPSIQFSMLHQSSCMAVEFKNIAGKSCFKDLLALIEPLTKQKKLGGIILAARVFPEQIPEYIAGIKKIESLDVPLIVMAGMPSFLDSIDNFIVKKYNANKRIPAEVEVDDFSMYRSGQDQIASRLRASLDAVPVVDFYKIRCDSTKCPLFLDGAMSRPIIFDREHLTLDGINWLTSKLSRNEVLKKFLSI
ncbi:acyltransferase family protein [Polaromonas sp.]|uniref:acyltransferase family protein n=1 Tax=Polaromonas sp. TaxID=1869339 RepID=UPI00375333A4